MIHVGATRDVRVLQIRYRLVVRRVQADASRSETATIVALGRLSAIQPGRRSTLPTSAMLKEAA
jgi:hypothetical protein